MLAKRNGELSSAFDSRHFQCAYHTLQHMIIYSNNSPLSTYLATRSSPLVKTINRLTWSFIFIRQPTTSPRHQVAYHGHYDAQSQDCDGRGFVGVPGTVGASDIGGWPTESGTTYSGLAWAQTLKVLARLPSMRSKAYLPGSPKFRTLSSSGLMQHLEAWKALQAKKFPGKDP